MGYTHYYSINTDSPEWKAIWPQFVDDVHKIISRCDVALAGSAQEGVGREVPPLVDLKEGIYLNGVDEDSHEPFAIGCKNHYGFTKTAFKPYDKVVTCILLRAYMLAPSACGILSDGFWAEWDCGRSLYENVFGDKPECPWDEVAVEK